MSKIHMMALYRVKGDKVEEARQAISSFVKEIRENEPGALFYESYQGREDLSFFHLMTFEDTVAQELHWQTPHMARFATALESCCEEEPGFVELELVGSNVR